ATPSTRFHWRKNCRTWKSKTWFIPKTSAPTATLPRPGSTASPRPKSCILTSNGGAMLRIHQIASLDLPELQPYRTMRQQLEHRRQQFFIAEGEKVVRRLLESRFTV